MTIRSRCCWQKTTRATPLVQEALKEANAPFALDRVTQLSEVLERVTAGRPRWAPRLGLPTARARHPAGRAGRQAGCRVVLTTFDEESSPRAAAGAQEYLTKAASTPSSWPARCATPLNANCCSTSSRCAAAKSKRPGELQSSSGRRTSDTGWHPTVGVRASTTPAGDLHQTPPLRRHPDPWCGVRSGDSTLRLDQLTMAAGLAVLHAGPATLSSSHAAAHQGETLTPARNSPPISTGRVVSCSNSSASSRHYRPRRRTREAAEVLTRRSADGERPSEGASSTR